MIDDTILDLCQWEHRAERRGGGAGQQDLVQTFLNSDVVNFSSKRNCSIWVYRSLYYSTNWAKVGIPTFKCYFWFFIVLLITQKLKPVFLFILTRTIGLYVSVLNCIELFRMISSIFMFLKPASKYTNHKSVKKKKN